MNKDMVRSFRSAQCPPVFIQQSDQFLASHDRTIHIVHTCVNIPTAASGNKKNFWNGKSRKIKGGGLAKALNKVEDLRRIADYKGDALTLDADERAVERTQIFLIAVLDSG